MQIFLLGLNSKSFILTDMSAHWCIILPCLRSYTAHRFIDIHCKIGLTKYHHTEIIFVAPIWYYQKIIFKQIFENYWDMIQLV